MHFDKNMIKCTLHSETNIHKLYYKVFKMAGFWNFMDQDQKMNNNNNNI